MCELSVWRKFSYYLLRSFCSFINLNEITSGGFVRDMNENIFYNFFFHYSLGALSNLWMNSTVLRVFVCVHLVYLIRSDNVVVFLAFMYDRAVIRTRGHKVLLLLLCFCQRYNIKGTPHTLFVYTENNLISVKRSDWLGYLSKLYTCYIYSSGH